MNYYDDDDYYTSYDDDEYVEPINIIGRCLSEKDLTDIIASAGLTYESRPKYSGPMEKLVFLYGEDSEVYSPAEIQFIDRIGDVFVYPDFIKKLNQGNMVCRAIATKLNYFGHDALKACVSFEKIIDKALEGFNIFFFITEESVFFGCRFFDSTGNQDCVLSNPITAESEFEEVLYELSFLAEIDSFLEYYTELCSIIKRGQYENKDYEHMIIRRRGMRMSYYEDLCRMESELGVTLHREKERYWHMFHDEPEESFVSLLKEVEESLSFIKSNRVNTYEMLFEADEMMRQAEVTEAENQKLAERITTQDVGSFDAESDEEAKALLDDPEEMVKLLKKRRGM